MSRRYAWPVPYFQSNPTQDCQFYAAAYLCRCFGFADVTAEHVMAFRATPYREPGRFLSETHYPEMVCGLEMFAHWLDNPGPDGAYNDRWWLGSTAREWCEQMLAEGWLASMRVMRVREMAHAVVLLESHGDAGALIFDPHEGHVMESWAWLLGPGPRHKDTDGWADSHRIEAWYRKPQPSE